MVTLLTSLLLSLGTIGPAEPPPATRPATQQLDQAEALWAEAIQAIEANDLERAAELFERVAAILPDHPVVWQNLGQVRQNLGQHEQSLAAWREVSRIEPDDWRAVSKQVQCLQALDRPEERDKAIARLYALNDEGKVEEPYFCREQFEVEGRKVMTYERFDLKGERAVRWSFYVLDDAGEIADRWSVGSYEATTALSREIGDIKPDERLFHLDHYPAGGGHGTFAFYVDQPPYETARADFIAGLTGRVRPMSASGPYQPPSPAATRPATQHGEPPQRR